MHQAVRHLLERDGRDHLSVPAIAVEAGVTPSTIYRRWGDLGQLLADVAVQQWRPDTAPTDTGSFRGDLQLWLEQYVEEMASAPGRAMLREVLGSAGPDGQARCMFYCTRQLDALRERGLQRGETVPDADRLIDRIVAPAMYRILFAGTAPTADALQSWLSLALQD